MRKAYLEEHRPGLYERLLLSGKLYEHLADIDTCCAERMDRMVRRMADAEGITESLKATDQMAWVGRMNRFMNNRRAASSEAVYNTELQVYTDFSINVQHHLRPNYEVKHHFFRFAYVRLFEGHFGGQCFSKCTSNPLKPMKHEYYQTEIRLLCNHGD